MDDEAELIRSIMNGNIQSFGIIVQQYEKLVFSILNRMLQSREDIEDTGQDIFVKVFDQLKHFRRESKLSTWIGRIAYHTAINHLKKNAGRHSNKDPDDLENFHFSDETPAGKLEERQSAAYINTLVSQLPLQYRTVVTLFHLNEFSHKEIMEITGLPEGTIKGYLFRARKLLKEKIEAHEYR